eukprot:TRINITY_DN9310_c0_g1_i1.p1 TRINITY_DN9310_c0_g1~~TRINITY_DN9310_c0_g1_i1.p1  ORF type:complete len:270 (+),score=63.88 TRINITY_DN9310_c0_g1_i1:606-1415(+)
MEWQVVFHFAEPRELLNYRLVCRNFSEMFKTNGMWRGYLMAVSDGCEATQDFSVCEGVEEVMTLLRVNCPEEVARLRVQHARAVHRKHWGRMYCPLSWGKEAYDAAVVGMRDGQGATKWIGLWMSAWNGARSLMKESTLVREMFQPFLEYARALRKAPEPYSALGTFTEGYVYYAMGFSSAGNPQDFTTAFELQLQGLHQYPNHDEILVEMQERLARTSIFTDPTQSTALYQEAFNSATRLWNDPSHPLAKSIVFMLQYISTATTSLIV